MVFSSLLFLFRFLPAVLILYYIAPRKLRNVILLLFSLFFYAWGEPKYVFLMLFTITMDFFIGKGIDKAKKEGNQKKAKRFLMTLILVDLSILGFFKYADFLIGTVNTLTGAGIPLLGIPLPIGISFYTLQAIGYMADVYWGKIPAERHLGKVALFLGFFPQIMEGPIAMYSQTADALWSGESLKSENLAQGSIRILWGLFKKMIIADRLYYLVTEVFDHYENYSGAIVIVAAVSYAVQLYMEFSGCMDIVIGSGQMFGVRLPENFNQPFASKSAAEFWRRWHMTLGVWFKTYVFYPVSVSPFMRKWNKFGKKHVGKYMTKLVGSAIALFPVWLFNGLWHGPQWNYIFYGMYYFVILLLEVACEPLKEKFYAKTGTSETTGWWNVLRIAKTWIIIFTGELFFRANMLTAGFSMFASIFRGFAPERLWDGTLLRMGLDLADYSIIIAGCIVVGIVGHLREKKKLSLDQIAGMRLPARWGLYYALIFAVILFGAYGVGYQQVDLIYAGF